MSNPAETIKAEKEHLRKEITNFITTRLKIFEENTGIYPMISAKNVINSIGTKDGYVESKYIKVDISCEI